MSLRDKIIAAMRQGNYYAAASTLERCDPNFLRSKNAQILGIQIFFNLPDRPKCLKILGDFCKKYLDDQKSFLFALEYYEKLNCQERCISIARKAARQFPTDIKILSEYARLLQTNGNFALANSVYEKIFARFGLDGQVVRMYSSSINGKELERDFIQRCESKLKNLHLDPLSKINMAFGLGKIFDDLHDYDKAYHYYEFANSLQHATDSYRFQDRLFEASKYLNMQKALPNYEASSSIENRPIFITGVPRSGTTMIESRISRSGDVVAAGEVAIAFKTHYRFFCEDLESGVHGKNFRTNMEKFKNTYQSCLASRFAKNSSFITDKSMRNFLISGYLATAFPQSKIIFVSRNPFDIAQSLYRNYFRLGTHTYSNRLEDIAKEIAIFEFCRSFFESKFDQNVLNLHYEKVVADPEAQLNYVCGAVGVKQPIKADDTSAIRTLSVYQARQPIHTRQVASWQRYPKLFNGFDRKLDEAREQVRAVLQSGAV
jgi:tetratricopeptide (TPR) repeat protein